MTAHWHEYDFTVGMPLMAPGERLCEVELLKLLALRQWESIAALLGRPPGQIESELGQRLYGSVICCELGFGRHSVESLGEDAHITVRNTLRTHAQRFVEGLFVFDDRPVPEELLTSIKTRSDLAHLGLPWAYFANAFIAREGSNTALSIYKPVGFEENEGVAIEEPPEGIADQRRVLATGEIDAFEGSAAPRPLPRRDDGPLAYQIVPESDLNGAGLVYFARFVAMANYGERLHLGQQLEQPWSSPVVACLSTEQRRVFFFGNANPHDSILIRVTSELLPGDDGIRETPRGPYRCPLKLLSRIDLYRASDRVLVTSTLARRALHLPAKNRSLQHEAARILRALG